MSHEKPSHLFHGQNPPRKLWVPLERTHNGLLSAEGKLLLADHATRLLDEAKGLWVEQPLSIVLAYHCTPQTSTGETPFWLAFRTDTMIPVEIREPSLRCSNFDLEDNANTIRVDLNLVEEVREQAYIRQSV
ncbi:hypothetical protein CR513_57233, partial [Mucuna pruriens]